MRASEAFKYTIFWADSQPAATENHGSQSIANEYFTATARDRGASARSIFASSPFSAFKRGLLHPVAAWHNELNEARWIPRGTESEGVEKMAILVTGATGLLGNNVVRRLLERGESVRVLVRNPSETNALKDLAVEAIRGDVQDLDAVRSGFQDVDRVIHCAAQVHIGWTGGKQQRATNVEGTRNVADTALATGARMVHVSSIDALGIGTSEHPANENSAFDGEVLCPYVATKREAEQVVLDRVAGGLDAVIVNPGFMLGPWDWKPSSGRMLLKIAAGWGLLAPPGSNSYCDVRDVADGVLAALEKGQTGTRYVLAGETHSYREACKVIARVTGGLPPVRTARKPMVNLVGCAGDLFAWMTGHESDVNSATSKMSLTDKYFSSARAESELGYRTRGIENSAADAWAWFQKYGYAKA
jgi:dihydroflavonol-4-reductase